jgi:hypothetical protein
MPDANDELLTKIEAAALLKVSTRTLEVWAAKRLIKPIHFGRTVRYLRDELLAQGSAAVRSTSRTVESTAGAPKGRPLAGLAEMVRRKVSAV